MARNILGLTYLKTGDVTRAVSELEVARKLSSGPRTMSTLAYGYGLAGSTGQARMVLDELVELSKTRYTSAFALAVAYAGAGDRTEALSHLEAAFDERSDTMAVLRVYPVVDALRNEPRFKELLRKVGSGL
jgi:cytochrome c-type biogenesis protein CcmH/NrfG